MFIEKFMLKNYSIYSFLALVITFAFLSGAPCHSMELQHEEEGTYVGVQASKKREHAFPASKLGYFKILPIEVLTGIVNYLEGPELVEFASASHRIHGLARDLTVSKLTRLLPRDDQGFLELSLASLTRALALVDKNSEEIPYKDWLQKCPKEQLPHLFTTLELLDALVPAFNGQPEQTAFLQSSSHFIETKILSGQIPEKVKESYDMLKPAHLTFTRRFPQIVNRASFTFENQVGNEYYHRKLFKLTPKECEWFSLVIPNEKSIKGIETDFYYISGFMCSYIENENRLEFLQSLYDKIPEKYGEDRFKLLEMVTTHYRRIAQDLEITTLYHEVLSTLFLNPPSKDIWDLMNLLHPSDYGKQAYKKYLQEVKSVLESTDPLDMKIRLIKDERGKVLRAGGQSGLSHSYATEPYRLSNGSVGFRLGIRYNKFPLKK